MSQSDNPVASSASSKPWLMIAVIVFLTLNLIFLVINSIFQYRMIDQLIQLNNSVQEIKTKTQTMQDKLGGLPHFDKSQHASDAMPNINALPVPNPPFAENRQQPIKTSSDSSVGLTPVKQVPAKQVPAKRFPKQLPAKKFPPRPKLPFEN